MYKNQAKTKTCPFIDRACLKTECAIYHEGFDKCDIDLIPYNLFKNTEALLKQTEPERSGLR
ncbi:MAG: hypothetical protein RBT11_08765 [Desulfobacterales bacterium]|nr:hypothetical protein [Desulfobacterales bacterium]